MTTVLLLLSLVPGVLCQQGARARFACVFAAFAWSEKSEPLVWQRLKTTNTLSSPC